MNFGKALFLDISFKPVPVHIEAGHCIIRYIPYSGGASAAWIMRRTTLIVFL